MAEMRIRCLVDIGALVGEGPVWDDRTQRLWWTDINGRVMHCFDPADETNTSFKLPVRVGSFALRESGGFVLAAEHGFWLWNPASGALDHLHDIDDPSSNHRMNDGGCDRQGRFVASSMNLDDVKRPTGGCWRLDADLGSERLLDGLHIGNGIAFSPTGDRFYVADTLADTVWVHDYDIATGRIGPRREFIRFDSIAGRPDGATVDAEGAYWIAAVFGSCIHRFLPDGRLDRTIAVPVTRPTRPMFGGKALDQLYFTSLGIDGGEPQAGGLFRIDGLGITGLPEPRFRG